MDQGLGLVQLPSHSCYNSLHDDVVWIGWSICCTCQLEVVKTSFSEHSPLYVVLTLLLGEMLDLQDMDNMEASCIFYVKVGTFDQLE